VLLQHTLRYLPAQLLSPLAQLLSMVLWTHWLTPQQMGIFTLTTVTQEVAFLLSLNWFSVYALRYQPAAEDRPAVLRYLATENMMLLLSVVLGLLLAFGSAWLWADPQDLWLATAAIGAYFVTRSASSHYAERARAQSSFVAYSLLQTAGPVGGLLVGLVVLTQWRADAWALLLAYALAQALGIVAALPRMGMLWSSCRPDREFLRAALRFGPPMIALGVLGWIGENYIRYMVQWREGAATLGLMIVGWALGRRCASVASMLVTTAAFPLASRLLNQGRRGEALLQLRNNAALLMAVLMPITAGVMVLGPTLVALTVAQEYQQVTAELLALSVFAGALRNLHMHITDQLMVLERRFAMLARVDVAEIVLCVVASWVGLVYYGLHGAIWGQAIGSALSLMLSMYWAKTRLQFDWPRSESFKILAATGAMSAALLSLPPWSHVAGLVAASLVGTLVYGLALAALFHRELRQRMATWQAGRSAEKTIDTGIGT
jgi:O-antigen/teichoic acid export membrane protein